MGKKSWSQAANKLHGEPPNLPTWGAAIKAVFPELMTRSADWTEVSAPSIHRLVCTVARSGGVVSFGYNLRGTKLALTLYCQGEKTALTFEDGLEAEAACTGLADALDALPEPDWATRVFKKA